MGKRTVFLTVRLSVYKFQTEGPVTAGFMLSGAAAPRPFRSFPGFQELLLRGPSVSRFSDAAALWLQAFFLKNA